MELDITQNLNSEPTGGISTSLRRNLITLAGAIGCTAIAGMGYMGVYNDFYNQYLNFYNNGGEAAITLAEESINIFSLVGAGYFIYRGIRPTSITEESVIVMPISETNYGLLGLRKQKRKFNSKKGICDIRARIMPIQRDLKSGESIHNEEVVIHRLGDAIVGASEIKPQNDYTMCHKSVNNPVDTEGNPVTKIVKREIPIIGRTIVTKGVRVTEKRYHVIQTTPDARKLNPTKYPSGLKLEPKGDDWCNFQIAFPLEMADEIAQTVTTPNYEKHELQTKMFKSMQSYGESCNPNPQRPMYIIEWIDGQEPIHHAMETTEKVIQFLNANGIELTGLNQTPPERPAKNNNFKLLNGLMNSTKRVIANLKPLINFN